MASAEAVASVTLRRRPSAQSIWRRNTSGYNAHKERRQGVVEGKLSVEDTRKTARMNVLRSVAIAVTAVGIKSAYREWKRVKQIHQQR
jgi:hypothetical protein